MPAAQMMWTCLTRLKIGEVNSKSVDNIEPIGGHDSLTGSYRLDIAYDERSLSGVGCCAYQREEDAWVRNTVVDTKCEVIERDRNVVLDRVAAEQL